MIMAAGIGSRLKPWTDSHPKALVPVGGIPMLERVILRLRDYGFDRIVVNVHHFAGQIIDFLASKDFGVSVKVSDESGRLLDTGGALVKAAPLLTEDDEPFLVHNVDILSDAPLGQLMESHRKSERNITLLTSNRDSSRRLIFAHDGRLKGWHNITSGEYRPGDFTPADDMRMLAFSGIYFMDVRALASLQKYEKRIGEEKFPIMDFLLSLPDDLIIGNLNLDSLHLIDIGKPDTLTRARALFGEGNLDHR